MYFGAAICAKTISRLKNHSASQIHSSINPAMNWFFNKFMHDGDNANDAKAPLFY